MIFSKIFGTNPFKLLEEHMTKSVLCVQKINEIFNALFTGDKAKVAHLAKEISQIEHECDVLKQAVREVVHKAFFLPVDRRDVLHVLSNMDNIANDAEDIGVLLTMRWMELSPELKADFLPFLAKSCETVFASAEVIKLLDRLVETGFSGPDADEVLQKIIAVERLEHEADKTQDVFAKALFNHEESMKPAALFMWMKISEKVGDLANSSQRMVNHVRLMLFND